MFKYVVGREEGKVGTAKALAHMCSEIHETLLRSGVLALDRKDAELFKSGKLSDSLKTPETKAKKKAWKKQLALLPEEREALSAAEEAKKKIIRAKQVAAFMKRMAKLAKLPENKALLDRVPVDSWWLYPSSNAFYKVQVTEVAPPAYVSEYLLGAGFQDGTSVSSTWDCSCVDEESCTHHHNFNTELRTFLQRAIPWVASRRYIHTSINGKAVLQAI